MYMKKSKNAMGIDLMLATKRDMFRAGANKTIITLEIYEKAETIEELTSHDKLEVGIRKYSPKRSLNANAYFHKLIGLLAQKLNVSTAYLKNYYINQTDCYQWSEDGTIVLSQWIPTKFDDITMEYEKLHLKPTAETTFLINGKGGNEEVRRYIVMRGTHTYTRSEMAFLIQIVVTDCKEQNIPTETKEMVEKMLERWGVKNERF